MRQKPEIASELSRRRFLRVVLVVVVCSAALFWLFSAVGGIVSLHISRAYPEWAWRHGTPAMQYVASKVLIQRIQPGMNFEQVLALLGPGSAGWPVVKERVPRSEDNDIPEVVSFNLRDSGNIGIDVYFLHKHVSRVALYD